MYNYCQYHPTRVISYTPPENPRLGYGQCCHDCLIDIAVKGEQHIIEQLNNTWYKRFLNYFT